jgi:DNA-binding CsgD family transcriptional regulator
VTAAKDSLNQLSLKESFAGLEKKYNYQRIAAENNKLMVGSQQKMNFVLMLLLALFALIIFFLLFFLYKKKEELILQQKIATQEKERANLVEQQHQLKEMLRKKIDAFKQIALSSNASIKQAKAANGEDHARQLEEALSNIDAYHNHISSRLQTQFHCLSQTEIRITLLILEGFTSSQIADLLDTSENTVNVNRSAIRKKLKIEGKSDLTDFLAHF